MIQTILGKCPSKSNCYKVVNLNDRASRSKTKALKEYEERFYIQCDKYHNAGMAGYFELHVFELHVRVFYPSQRTDLDNSLKIILDCLQRVKAIQNDNKCVKIVAEKFLDILDKLNPRIEFEIKTA